MKQTALQQLIAWGDERLKAEPMKTLSFAEAIDKAEELLEMEKEQIINAHIEGQPFATTISAKAEQYYNETYNK